MAGLRSLTRLPLPAAPSLGRWRDPALVVLLALSAVFCGWSAWALATADTGPRAAFATERDQVLEAGKRQIAVLNTIDGARVDEGLKQWQDATTGALHDELAGGQAAAKQAIEKAGTTSSATVLEAAVTALDQAAGDAQIIASVEIQVTGAAGKGGVQRKRFQAGLARTDGGWKLKSFTAVQAVTG
ncbi:hypothetical protein OIE66_11800 [Nonomuraea sp. NBC_01738]|uniref:hypothetical protein n=1 Tax=Nonomuraea sp. NBC_01738 TaxID=2976003 RepID=UPI002E0ECD92|nr:hypothetical protein OIE66_11800 [Nonomuraea sp. NBC_01738]